MDQLQTVGVPAGRMTKVSDLPSDPQLVARGFFLPMTQPGIDGEFLVENGPAIAEQLPTPLLRPAPFYGEHTREVCADVLGFSDAQIDDLVTREILDELSDKDAARRTGTR
jgi:crotonobetainyl-CoA:carnitine CoA-transferase CaiB-like acyl-CoA transferase